MLLTSDLHYMQALGDALATNFNIGKFFMAILPFIPFIVLMIQVGFIIAFIHDCLLPGKPGRSAWFDFWSSPD